MPQAEAWRGTILLVEDDEAFAERLRQRLTAAGFSVWIAPTGAAAETAAASVGPDIVIVDLAVEDQHGLVVCANLKEAMPGVPIIVCSSTPGKDDPVLAFKLGAADFVARDASLEEFEIRVERAMLPAAGTRDAPEQPRLTLGPLELDPTRHSVLLAGKPMPTTPTEFRLLAALLQRGDEVVSVADLAQAVWGSYDMSMEASIRVHLRRLRAKLRASPAPAPVLVAARGFGYRLTFDAADPMAPG